MADNKIDFQPIDFKPIEQSSEASEPGQVEALVRGLAQGGTLGFADEATGAGEAGIDLLRGKTDLQHLLDAYRQHRDESRSNYAAAKEAHPITTTVGEIGSALIPGAGLLGGAAKGAGLANALVQGAKIGGIAGLGASESDTLQGDVKQAAQGALYGAGAGGLLHGLVQGVGKLAGSDLGRNVKDAYQAGKEGESLLNKADLENLATRVRGQAEDVSGKLGQEKNAASQAIGQGLKTASESGAKVDVSKGLAEVAGEGLAGASRNTPETQRAVDLINNIAAEMRQSTGMTPEKAQFYKKMLDNELDYKQGQPNINSEAEYLLNKARGLITGDIQKALPAESGAAYKTFGGIANVQNASKGDIGGKLLDITRKMQDLADPKNQKEVEEFFETVAKNLGPDKAAELREQVGKNAQRMTSGEIATARDPLQKGDPIQRLLGTVTGAPVRGANAVGLGVSGAKNTLKDLVGMTPQAVQGLAQKFSASAEKPSQMLGQMLNSAAAGDDAKRKALMFAITQNPIYRSLLGIDLKAQ